MGKLKKNNILLFVNKFSLEFFCFLQGSRLLYREKIKWFLYLKFYSPLKLQILLVKQPIEILRYFLR